MALKYNETTLAQKMWTIVIPNCGCIFPFDCLYVSFFFFIVIFFIFVISALNLTHVTIFVNILSLTKYGGDYDNFTIGVINIIQLEFLTKHCICLLPSSLLNFVEKR